MNILFDKKTKYPRTFIYAILLALISISIVSCSVSVENSFKEITGEDYPENSKILFTEDSPTDFHGNYGRILIIKVEPDFYNELSIKLVHKGFKLDTENPMFNEFTNASKYIKLTEINSQFKLEGNDFYHYVGFYNDKESIVLIRSSW